MTLSLETPLSLLSDVDGVTADLVGGLRKFINDRYGFDFEPSQVIYHNDMGRSPELLDLNEELKRWFPGDGPDSGFGGAFACFMRDPNVYTRWVDPVPGSVDAIAEIRSKYEVVFVTALMKRARDHFRSKMEWIERWFPNLSIMTSPSGDKFRVHGTYAIDDRFDTCMRWIKSGTHALLFRQPWNEVTSKIAWPSYDWGEITKIVMEEK